MQPQSVKKEVVKNYLSGLDPDANIGRVSSSQGVQLDRGAIESVVDEFESDASSRGLDQAAKTFGVGRIARELAEIAVFKRKNNLELPDMLRGGKIARVLKNHGAGIPELEQFLESVYSRVSEKGYDFDTVVIQTAALNDLEKKYDMDFDKLKATYDQTGMELDAMRRESSDVLQQVAHLKKKTAELLTKYELDEHAIREYSDTKQKLLSFGLDTNNLQDLSNFLVSLKSEKFDAKQVIHKLNSISDLAAEKSKLEQETIRAKNELGGKTALLNELTKLERSELSIEQIEGIRSFVVRISRDQGIEPVQAFNQFEQELLQNYNSILGLKPILNRLEENKKRREEELDLMRQQHSAEEAAHANKIKKLEEKYSKLSAEIVAVTELREMGIDGKTIQSWHNIMKSSRLELETVKAELENHASLKNFEKDLNERIKELEATKTSLNENVGQLRREKESLESSIRSLTDSALHELDAASSKMLSSIAELNQKTQSSLAQTAS
ncbi:MAG: hypothetical protein ACRDF4_11605, partial [Rhabdochlamydiaceae bacterium]